MYFWVAPSYGRLPFFPPAAHKPLLHLKQCFPRGLYYIQNTGEQRFEVLLYDSSFLFFFFFFLTVNPAIH